MSAVLAAHAQPTGVIDQPMNEIFDSGNAAMMLNAGTLNAMLAFADQMAKGVIAVPQHLRKQPADCLAVVMQAAQWGMNPFAVAQKTHVVNGALGYEAQLVNAVLEQSGAILGRFHYEYKGDGDALECRVAAVPRGEKDLVWGEWLACKSVTTKNSPLWKTNPKQQLGYLQVKNWARAFKPGAILGVYTADELEDNPPPPFREMGAVEEVHGSERAAAVSDLINGRKPEPTAPPSPKLDPVLARIKAATTADELELTVADCSKIENQEDKKIARKAWGVRMKELGDAAKAGTAGGAPTADSTSVAGGTPAPGADLLGDAPPPTYAQIEADIRAATTREAVDTAKAKIVHIKDQGQQADLHAECAKQIKSFTSAAQDSSGK